MNGQKRRHSAELAGQRSEPEEGSSDSTLVLYCLFMAASSILFGGLSIWHTGGNASSHLSADASTVDIFLVRVSGVMLNLQSTAKMITSLPSGLSPEVLVWLSSMACLVVLLAFATNPSDASFKSYLTDASLHQHLQHFRQDALNTSARRLSDLSADDIQGIANKETERASSHIHPFTNRISISLRTPAYSRLDYGLFSTTSLHEQDHYGQSHKRLYIGAFGKWWILYAALVGAQQSSQKASPNSQASTWGLLSMYVRESNPEAEDTLQPEAARRGSIDDMGGNQSSHEKSVSGKRKKHGNRHRPPSHSPLVSSTKDASTSYDSRLGEEGAATANGISGSPTILSSSEATPASTSHFDSPGAATQSNQARSNDHEGHSEAIAEAQSQLEQMRTASESVRQTLQSQLDELRARKKDEDAARLDMKGRTKTLDEHKRQAEGTRREAERRLKAANGVRDAIKARIDAKTMEMAELRRKETGTSKKAGESTSSKAKTIDDLRMQIEARRREEREADGLLEDIMRKVERLQSELLEEEGNLQAAREMAVERYAYFGDSYAVGANGETFLPQTPQQHVLHHAGPYDAAPQSLFNAQSGPMFEQGTHSNTGGLPFQEASWPHRLEDAPLAPQARSLTHVAAMLANEDLGGEGELEEEFNDAFDPTVAAPDYQAIASRRFSPFSMFDGSSSNYMSALDRNRTESATPISPFQSDLLPSNLFQNADEDERHAGILPGTRSEQVEAALNRFGLDTSDTSDAEGAENSNVKDSQQSDDLEEAPTSNGRSWWGGRARSKERTSSSGVVPFAGLSPSKVSSNADDASKEPDTKDEASVGKRRSLSIFPKLSLNPGAKSFRGSNKRGPGPQNTAASLLQSEGDLNMQRAWNASSGQLPATQHDYESLRRAFEADDSIGRASLDLPPRNPQSIGWLASSGWPSVKGDLHDSQLRSSSDSLAFTNTMPRRAFNVFGRGNGTANASTDWLDEMILPLDRTTSRGSQHSVQSAIGAGNGTSSRLAGTVTSGDAATSTSTSQKPPSRFALWRTASGLRGTGNADGVQADHGVPSGGGGGKSEGDGASMISTDTQSTNPAEGASMQSTNSTTTKSKRTSFLWPSRKNDANATQGSTEPTEEASSSTATEKP